MKIGLITIHYVTNYGAVLQAYATAEILSKYGEVTIINYQKKHLSHHMDLFRFKLSIRGFKMLGHDILNFRSRSKMLAKFKQFINSSMNLSDQLEMNDLVNGKASGFDLYVCGSDQIWNPIIVSEKNIIDPMFFLSFAPSGSRKISYASSIGNHHFTEAEKPIVKELLDDFTKISTREGDGRNKLLEILDEKKIQQVLDPTLLLSKKEWLNKFSIKLSETEKKYILVYSVPRTSLIREAILFFSKKLNYKVVSIDKMLYQMPGVDDHISDADPIEFIKLFANASFIITDSFHGLCFSVNFEKPFAAISANRASNRQENLLTLLGMEERLMRSKNDFEDLDVQYEITNDKKMILKKLRDSSLNFLDLGIKMNN